MATPAPKPELDEDDDPADWRWFESKQLWYWTRRPGKDLAVSDRAAELEREQARERSVAFQARMEMQADLAMRTFAETSEPSDFEAGYRQAYAEFGSAMVMLEQKAILRGLEADATESEIRLGLTAKQQVMDRMAGKATQRVEQQVVTKSARDKLKGWAQPIDVEVLGEEEGAC